MQLKSRWYRASMVSLLALSGLLVSCDSGELVPPKVQDMFGIVTGQILVDGEGLAGLNVSISTDPARITQSDANGSFSFTDVEVGAYTVTISGQDAEISFTTQSAPVTVVGRQTATVSFTGTIIRTASITGTVTLDGAGEAGRQVSISGVESASTETSGGGQYSFTGLRKGSYTVALGGVDNTVRFESTTQTVVVGIGEAGTADFTGIREVFATGRINFIEDVTSGARLGFNTIAGNVEVLVTVDGGTRTLSMLRVRFRGNLVGELDLSASAAAVAPNASFANFRIPFNTTVFDPDTGAPTIANGDGVLSLEIETTEDGAFEADMEDITITNRDQIGGILFVTGDTDPGVVAQGKTWWGNKDLDFRVVPVLYSTDVTVGSIEVEANTQPSANGVEALDFGSGPGAPHRVMGPNFTFTATAALNKDVVEDDPARDGHVIVIRRVFDSDGVDISGSFLRSVTLSGLYFDFTGPVAGATSLVLVDGGVFAPNRWYSSGDFSIRDVTETGIGGVTSTVDVIVGGVTIQQDVTNMDELAERKREYQLQPGSLVDLLGNQGAVSAISLTSAFGVDRTALTISSVKPSVSRIINPTDDVGDGDSDNKLQFTLADPILADATAGSGFGSGTLTGTDQDGLDYDISSRIGPNALGANLVTVFGALSDGTYSMTLVTTDNALPANTTTQAFDFTIDDTAPTTNLTEIPAGAIASGSGILGMTVGGIVSDANGLLTGQLTVRDAGANATCEIGDALFALGTGAGQVNKNSVSILDTADSFSETFSFTKLGPATRQIVCFWVTATDVAVDVNGGSEPNSASAFTRTVIDWT
jgi:carboxypeptidase family protein